VVSRWAGLLFAGTNISAPTKKIIMKMKLMPLAAAAMLLFACNNSSSKDSVDKADSANAAKSDSSGVKNDSAASSTATQPAIKTDEKTTDFLVKAANGGMAEVKLAQLAKDKASAASVKEFADMMITDHGAANDKVKQLAAARNVTLPAEPDADHQKKADDLSKKTGKDFDKAYVDAMVKGHKETVDMFKNASTKVTDGDVKAFIDNTIPTLEHHLQRIQDIKKGIK
jgi:putative membrane protein